MKILYILGSFYPAQSGGPNNTIYWQAKAMKKKGVDVTVLSLNDGITEELKNKYQISFNKLNKIDGINAYYFSYRFNRYLSFKFYLELYQQIRRHDFVQLTSFFFPLSWITALLCIINNAPFGLAPRGELDSQALKFSKLIKYFMIPALKQIYNKAKFILVTAQHEYTHASIFFNKKVNIEIVPNYIESGDLLSKETIKDKKSVFYLGRIHPIKNLENLIRAYQSLPEQLKLENNLVIAGSGEEIYINSLKELADDNYKIQFLGHKQGNEKEMLYKNSKVFVLPSNSENFGNVVVEALSYSTPVIASQNTPWKGLEVNNCGKWVDNDAESIKEALKYYLELPDNEYLQQCKNAYNYVKNEFDVDKNIGKYINIIKKYIK